MTKLKIHTRIMDTVDAAVNDFDFFNQLLKFWPRVFVWMPARHHDFVESIRTILRLTQSATLQQVTGK